MRKKRNGIVLFSKDFGNHNLQRASLQRCDCYSEYERSLSEISKQESGSEGVIGYLLSGNIYHILTDGKPHLNMKTQLTDPFLLPLSLTNTKTPPPHLHPYNTVSKDILWKGNMKRHVLHLFFIISLFL